MANLYQPTFKYGGIPNPDITAGAKLIMTGLQTPGNIATQMADQERQASLDAQNKQLFDLKMAEVDRANKARASKELLASELMKLPTQKASTIVVTPAVTQADVANVRQSLLDKQFDVGTKYADAFNRLSAETVSKPVPGQFQEISNYDVVNVPGTQNQKYVDKQTGESLTLDPQSLLGKLFYGDKYTKKEVPIAGVLEVPKYTSEQIHELALKESGYSDKIGIYEAKLPKVSKEVTKTTMKNLSEKDLKQGKLDLIKRLTNEGSIPATMALEVANKINTSKTKKEQLDELKYLLDVREQSRKDKELEAKIESGYYNKTSSKSNKSDGIRTALQNLYEDYGSPDIIGTGDQASIERDLSILQSSGYTDNEMKRAINQARGSYKSGALLGVDEEGFVNAVEQNLRRMR